MAATEFDIAALWQALLQRGALVRLLRLALASFDTGLQQGRWDQVAARAVEAVAFICCSPASPAHQPLIMQLLTAGIPDLKQQLVGIMEACKQVEQQPAGQQWQQAQAGALLQMVGCVKTPAAEQHPATMTATRALAMTNVTCSERLTAADARRCGLAALLEQLPLQDHHFQHHTWLLALQQ